MFKLMPNHNIPTAVKVENLKKEFILPHEKHSGIKQALVNFSRSKKGYEHQKVLKGISFEIKHGEFFGIVGRNGSGKSTLLKLLAGIYTPNGGSVEVNGTLVPFIELGVGFNPELTGRENIFLNGALLGFSRAEMQKKYDDIVSFSELSRFMDQKLKNYSSGMQVRLAFSIAIQAQGDILLLDEVLAVGDAAFQQKCFEYFATLKAQKKTVILVTHSMASVERFCSRAMLIEAGEIVEIGSSKKVATAYENLFIEDMNESKENATKTKDGNRAVSVKAYVYEGGKKVSAVNSGKSFTVDLSVTARQHIGNLNIGVNIRTSDGSIVFSDNLARTVSTIDASKGKTYQVELEVDNMYTNGKYYIDVVAVDEGAVGDKVLFSAPELASFSVMGVRHHAHSMFHPPHIFKVK